MNYIRYINNINILLIDILFQEKIWGCMVKKIWYNIYIKILFDLREMGVNRKNRQVNEYYLVLVRLIFVVYLF